MIERQVKEIEKLLNQSDSLFYQEDDHYYILFSVNYRSEGILIQEQGTDTVIIWCNEVPNMSYQDSMEKIIECFNCKIIVPDISNSEHREMLLKLGFKSLNSYEENNNQHGISFVLDKR